MWDFGSWGFTVVIQEAKNVEELHMLKVPVSSETVLCTVHRFKVWSYIVDTNGSLLFYHATVCCDFDLGDC